jgi:NAD(P)-dependent dehydrogenase (short-subunit alcohol dehydrogenase family)
MSRRVIAVTGAFGALGSAVAGTLAKEGAALVLIDQAPLPAQAPMSDALVIPGIDLSDPAQAGQAVDRVIEQYGRLDGLINIAGTFRWQTVLDGDVSTWDFLYAVNLKTAVAMTKAALPQLIQSRGRIVNIAAGVAVAKAGVGFGAYAASKAGVAKLTESLAEEVKLQGVTVNAILPSIIDTPQNRRDMPDADFDRWVKPQNIADTISFLLSDKANAITGALIPVSGRI